VVQVLLDHGADVNGQGGEYGNPLQAASWGGHEKAVQVLLDRGADVNGQGGKYGNALQAASARGHAKVVQVLLDRGVEPELKNNYGRTALLWAGVNGNVAVVKLLIELDDVDQICQDQYGQMPLLLAAGNGHEAIVKLLMAEDLVGLSSKDNFSRTPLSWASRKIHANIVQVIHETYRENGIVIRDEDLNLGTSPVSDQESDITCTICLSYIPNIDIHHRYGICDHRDFDVCQDCLLYGALCLDSSHKLVKRTFEDGVLVELAA
jgi:ankyrin repeat protein